MGNGWITIFISMGADHVEGWIGYPFREESEYQGAPSWHYNLLFRSGGVIEKVFRMRDTMDCHYSKEPRLMFSSKRTNEGDYYLVDNLQFEYRGSGRVEIHSHRHTLKETKIDTMLMAKGRVFDMLGARCISVRWIGGR